MKTNVFGFDEVDADKQERKKRMANSLNELKEKLDSKGLLNTEICTDCKGSGQVDHDGSTCKKCRGLGEISPNVKGSPSN